MEPEDRAALEASLHYVCDNLHSLSQMLGILRANKVITKSLEDLINVEKVEYEKHKALISCLQKIKDAFSPLIQALHDTNQSHLAEYIIGKKETILDGPVRIRDSNEKISVSRLKILYKEHLKSHNPLYLFLDFEFDMEDDYVPLTLQSQTANEATSDLEISLDEDISDSDWASDENISDSHKTFNKDIYDLDVFIEKAFSNFPLAIVIGDPFSGKTTLLQKIAFDWANIGRFQQYDIILLSEFRLLPNGNYKSILDLALAGVSEINLTNNIDFSRKRVLILIDGYDEKRQNQICNQLDLMLSNNKKVTLGFDLLITSRPSSAFKRKRKALFWKINGFVSEDQQNDYIEKHFRNIPHKLSVNLTEIISAIKSDLDQSYSLRQLAKSPMMLTFFCLVHKNMKQITKAALFDAVVKFMIQRFDKKHPEKKILHHLAEIPIISHDALTDQKATEMVEQWRNFSQIKKIGKLAFDATLEKKFVFESNDFEINALATYIATFEEMGLLINTGQAEGVRASFSYQFMHRAIQEFFSTLHFLYWQTDTIRIMETLLDRNFHLTSIKSDHSDFVQMTFDVLMAERKEAALISISPLLSEIKSLYIAPTIRLQSQFADELRKEHAFFQSVMRYFTKIIRITINGMGAAVDFAWTFKLPHDHHGGEMTVYLINFDFLGTNELILSVNCSEHIHLGAIELDKCKFEPERLRLTVDGYLSHLKHVEIVLTPEMVEKLSILPESRFTPSEWSGILWFHFPEYNSKCLNSASMVQNSEPLCMAEDNEDIEDRAISRLLQIVPRIIYLRMLSRCSKTNFPNFSYFNLSFPNLMTIKHELRIDRIRFNDWNKLVTKTFQCAPNLEKFTIQLNYETIDEICQDIFRNEANFLGNYYATTFQGSSVRLVCELNRKNVSVIS